MECAGQVSQVTYRVLLEFITQVNGAYNDGSTTLTNSICPCSLMVEQRIYIPYATDNWLVWVRIPPGVPNFYFYTKDDV